MFKTIKIIKELSIILLPLEQILLALSDFFKNDVVVWNIQEELPFD